MIKKLHLLKLLVLILIASANILESFAQTSLWTNPITAANPSASNPYITGDVNNADVSVSGIGRGTSLTAVSTANIYNAGGWNTNTTMDMNAYFNWTITPDAGYRVSLTGFTYTSTRGSNGPNSFAFRTNAAGNNFTTNIGTPTSTGITISLTVNNISSATSFRLFGWNGNSGNASLRTFGINDFTFNGSILGSPTTNLSGFTYQYASGPSTAQSFQVNGSGLTNNTVTINGSASFEVSTTSATSGFGTSATLTATAGTLAPSTVWVRLKAGLDAGSYSETITIGAGNISGIPITVSGSVTGKPVTISGAVANDKVFDRTNAATISGTLSGVEAGDVVTLNGTGTFASVNVGTGISVTSTSTLGGADAGNYVLTQPTGLTASITPKSVTISGASANDKNYDGTATATLNGTLSGVIAPDAVTLNLSGTFANSNAGNNIAVTSTSTLSGAQAGNYVLIQPAGLNADIDPKTVTITGVTINTKPYDGTTTATINNTGSLSGVLPADAGNVNLDASGATAAFVTATAGNNKPANVSGYTISGSAASNYALSQPTGVTGNITPLSVSVSGAAAQNKIYDGTTAATITGTLSGVLPGDVVNFVGTGTFATADAGTNIAVTSTSTLTGADAVNYSLIQPTGLAADITPKTITVNATAEDKEYDGNTSASINGTLIGVINGDVVFLSGGGNFASPNVGNNITVIPSLSLSGADAGNYNLTQPTGLSADITPKSITVSGLVADDKVYDGTTTATISGTATLNGVEAGDDVTVNLGGVTANFNNKNVGNNKPVTVSGITLSGAGAGNYILFQPTGFTADITPKSITVNATAADKVYDRTTAATITGTLIGVEAGDVVNFNGSGTFATSNVGNDIAVTSTSTITGTNAGNYTLVQPTGLSADITSKPVTVASADAVDRPYDGTTNAVITGTLSGVISPDNVTLLGTGVFASPNVGINIPVTSTSSLGGAQASNYTLIQPTGITGNITARELTVSGAQAQDKVYDGNTGAVITGTLNGVIGGDNVVFIGTGVFSSAAAGTNKPVTSTSTLSGTDAANYTLTQPTGLTADILQRPLTAAVVANDKVYNGNTTATLSSITLPNLVPGDNVTVNFSAANFDNKNVGTDKTVTVVVISLGGPAGVRANYILTSTTATTTADITPRTLTVTATGINKVYDGNANATVTLSDNRVSGDVLTTSYTTATFNDENVGNNKPVSVSAISISGTDAGNYTLSSTTASTTADITPLALLVTASGVDKVYDGTTAAVVTLSDNRLTGDVLATSYTSANFDNKNVGTNKTVTVLGISLSGPDAGNYTANTNATTTADITARALTFSFTGNDKVYDATTTATLTFTDDRVSGDDISYNYTANFNNAQVGNNKPVTVSNISLSGTDAGNYTISVFSGSGTADITLRPITIVANDIVKVFNTNDPPLTYQISVGNLVGGDVVTGSLVRVPGEAVGMYAINQGTLAVSSNYTLTFIPGVFTISERAIIVTVTPGTINCFGGSTTLTVTQQGGGSGLSYSLNNGPFQLSNVFVVPAGTYQIKVKDSEGFIGTSNLVFVTQPALITSSFSENVCGSYLLPWGKIVSVSGNYTYTYKSANNCDSVVTANITVRNSSASVTNVTACGSYSWNNVLYSASGSYTFTTTNAVGCDSVATLNLTIRDAASLTSTEKVTVCSPLMWNGNIYTTSGTYTFNTINENGCDSTAILILNVTSYAISTPAEIFGPQNACIYIGTNEQVTYTIDKVFNADAYEWTVPAGVTVVSHPGGAGVNDTSIVVTFDNSFVNATNIGVRALSSCGNSDFQYISLKRTILTMPGQIEGPVDVCPYMQSSTNPAGTIVTYSVSPSETATSYNWSVPSGASIISHPNGLGINDTIITVLYSSSFTSGIVRVAAVNGCGASNDRVLQVKRSVPNIPLAISGPTSPCSIIGVPVTYSIDPVEHATSYNWTVPAGATLNGPNNGTSISVTFNSGFVTGTISVAAQNNCFTSIAKTLKVSGKLPSTPGNITTTNTQACPDRIVVYSIASLPENATSLIWEIPSAGTFISQTATSITVSYTSGPVSGTITVRGTNGCGVGNPRTINVNLPACTAPAVFAGTKKVPQSGMLQQSVLESVIFPNPTTSQFSLKVVGKNEKVTVRVYDLLGSRLKTWIVNPGEIIVFGNDLRPGNYLVEMIQGSERVTRKVMKQ